MKNRTNQRLEEITAGTLIVGVDVAKENQWARFVDYRGVEIGKAMLFKNNRQGFESIVARIREICKLKTLQYPIEKIMIGMEPTGHYWKALANYLMKEGFRVVCVNPYHTKKAKELDDKGIGVVTAASFLGEVGDPLRFQNARQIANYAGYNLVEDSSGKSKSGTCISKRGRKQLRSLLYQMAFTMVGSNAEMKALYNHLTTRKTNPLKKKQALVVVSKKIITVIYSLLKKQETYKPELVLGAVRKEMMAA